MRNPGRCLGLALMALVSLAGGITARAQDPPPPPPPPTPRPVEEVTINFTASSFRLSNIAKAKLDEVALMMKQDPDERAQVIGYAGASEGQRGGQALADERASAVKNYLVTRHGIDPSRMTTAGQVSAEKGRVALLTLTTL
jgi:outer membrane protein OmpA-like peptidoglycan-associated protein